MIIAVADQCGTCGKAIGESLALLRSRSGRKVLVIEADSPHSPGACSGECLVPGFGAHVPRHAITAGSLSAELEQFIPQYQDIVIETDGRDAPGRAALIAARLVIVPIHASQADLACHYALIARLNSARMFNPGLHVMFVIAAGCVDPSNADLLEIRSYVAQVMSATLCATVIHTSASPGADEIVTLYREVFPG